MEEQKIQLDETRKPHSEQLIGTEQWCHKNYAVWMDYKFYQEAGSADRFLIGEEYFQKRDEEAKLVRQWDLTESHHVTRIESEDDYVNMNFAIDLSPDNSTIVAQLPGIYQSNVWVRIPDKTVPIAIEYLARFHFVDADKLVKIPKIGDEQKDDL